MTKICMFFALLQEKRVILVIIQIKRSAYHLPIGPLGQVSILQKYALFDIVALDNFALL